MKKHLSKPKSSTNLRNEGSTKKKSTLRPDAKKRKSNNHFYGDDDDFDIEELDIGYSDNYGSLDNFDDDFDDDDDY